MQNHPAISLYRKGRQTAKICSRHLVQIILVSSIEHCTDMELVCHQKNKNRGPTVVLFHEALHRSLLAGALFRICKNVFFYLKPWSN